MLSLQVGQSPNPFESPAATIRDDRGPLQPELTQRATVWPTVLGIVGILFGILAAITGVIGLVWNVIATRTDNALLEPMRSLPGGQLNPSWEVMMQYAGWNIAVAAMTVVVALWLLVAGVLVLQRRRAARKVALSWVAAKSILVVLSSVLQGFVSWSTLQAMMRLDPHMDQMAGPAEPIMMLAIMLSVLSGLAWGLALPLFTLIWFSRSAIRRETAAWN